MMPAALPLMPRLQLRFDGRSTAIDCLSQVIEVTVACPASRNHADYLFMPLGSSQHRGRTTVVT